MIVYKNRLDKSIYQKQLDTDVLGALIEFINQRNLNLEDNLYVYSINKDELEQLIEALNDVLYEDYLEEKLMDYTVMSNQYIKRILHIQQLVQELEKILTDDLQYAKFCFNRNYLAIDAVVDEKLGEAVERYLEAVKYTQYGMYTQHIDLDESIEGDFFNSLEVDFSIGIGQIWSKDSIQTEKTIRLKGFQVSVTTDVKCYFTNICEVTYTAFHIRRNAKDHRYAYKEKRAQKTYRFLLDSYILVAVNQSNEKEFNKRKEEAKLLQKHFNTLGEKALAELYTLNNNITKPFLKNNAYYEQIFYQIKAFLENRCYMRIIQNYLLLDHMTDTEYFYHVVLISKLKAEIKEVIHLMQHNPDEVELITRQAALIRYFIASTDIAPKAGVIKVEKGTVHRTLMQIEQERGYSDEFRSDDSLNEYYKEMSRQKKF
ncbi:MAG: hypothetical protein ABS882_06540 [Lysinibacillus sp.]